MGSLPILALTLATLVYLLLDIYPSVRSFGAILRTGSFWLLWLVFVVLNLIAWGAIEVAIGTKAAAWVGRKDLADLLMIVLATLGTITVLQSFTLKAADVKVIDVGPLVDNYRRAVLAGVADKVRDIRRRKEQQIALAVAAKFSGKIPALRDHYHTAFSFGGKTTSQITADLTKLEADATAGGLSFEQLLAKNIVKADLSFAESLL